MKLSIEDIAHVLHQHKDLAPATVTAIIKDLQEAARGEAEEKEAEREAKAGQPKPYLMLLAMADGVANADTPFFAVESVGDRDHTTVRSRLHEAAATYNALILQKRGAKRKKHKRQPVETLGGALEAVPATILKPLGLKVRWREPLIVVFTDNNLDPALMNLPGAEGNETVPVDSTPVDDAVWVSGPEEEDEPQETHDV